MTDPRIHQYDVRATKTDVMNAKREVLAAYPNAKAWAERGQTSPYQIENDGRILGASLTSEGAAWVDAAQNIILLR